MRITERLRKLERSKTGGMIVGFLEKRLGCEATEDGVTHACIDWETVARADYKVDDDFWATVEARKRKLADRPLIWLPSDPRLL